MRDERRRSRLWFVRGPSFDLFPSLFRTSVSSRNVVHARI
jgi:hypothetical protein